MLPLALAVLAILLLPAQAAHAEDPYRIDVVQVDASTFPEVRVVAAVNDAAGRPVRGLAAADLVLSEEGRAQKPSVELASRTAPVVLALVFDTSGSMVGQPFADAKAAIGSLIQTLGPSDQAALLTFSTEIRLAQPLTSDKQALIGATNAAVAVGDTAIYDALVAATEMLATVDPKARRAVVFITDGQDTASRASAGDALARVGAAGYPVYVVGLGANLDRPRLQSLADASKGGQAFVAPTSSQLAAVYAGLSEQLLTQYSIRYRSEQTDQPDGATVNLRLQVIRTGTLLGEATTSFSVPRGRGVAPAPPISLQLAAAAAVIPPIPADVQPRSWAAALVGAVAALVLYMGIVLLIVQRGRLGRLRRRREVFLATADDASAAVVRPPREPFRRRVLVPFLRTVGAPLLGLAPGSMVTSARQRLAEAGDPLGMDAIEYLGLRAATGAALALGSALVVSVVDGGFIATLLAGVIAGLLGWVLPAFVIGSMGRKRKRLILRALPSTLDMLAVSVDAGLAFDGAISQVAQRWSNPLSDEFRRVLVEFQMGRERKQSLRELARRTGVAEVRRFVNAVTQADAMGVALSKVLQEQAVEMRVRRRQIAEEKARTAPIKMLFPMVFLIFPALFVVILGPAVPRLLQVFQNAN